MSLFDTHEDDRFTLVADEYVWEYIESEGATESYEGYSLLRFDDDVIDAIIEVAEDNEDEVTEDDEDELGDTVGVIAHKIGEHIDVQWFHRQHELDAKWTRVAHQTGKRE